jgi:multidrug efflux pump subunit AcrA (membrane-fusion protein)
LISICTLAFAITQMVKAQQKPTEITPAIEPGKSPYERQLAGAGILEPQTENIAVGSHVPGIVEKVYVKVGQIVRPGERLFQLDDRQLRAELAVRQASLSSARATLQKLKDTPREDERPANRAKITEAEVNVKDLTQTYERLKRLSGTSSISEDELSRKQMAMELAKAQLARVQSEFKLWEAGAWEPDRLIAKAAVELGEAQVKQTQIELSRLTMLAPNSRWRDDGNGTEVADTAGVEYQVLQVNIRPGEYVGNNPNQSLIVLGYVGQLHVRVDLDENDISRFKPELKGVAKPRGNPNVAFPLKFVRVDPYVIPKRSLTGANTERVDTRVLQVIYAIETQSQNLYVGQQVDVYLNAD